MRRFTLKTVVAACALMAGLGWAALTQADDMGGKGKGGDQGFKPLFNGKDLTGWKTFLKDEKGDAEQRRERRSHPRIERLVPPARPEPVEARAHAPSAVPPARSSARLILPLAVLGSSSTNSMTRGYL